MVPGCWPEHIGARLVTASTLSRFGSARMIIPSVRWREFVAIDLTRRDDCISPRTRRSGLPTPNRGRAINLPFGRGSRVHGRVTHCLPYIRVPKRVPFRTPT